MSDNAFKAAASATVASVPVAGRSASSPFRSDAEIEFPIAALLLLAALVIVAVVARGYRARGGAPLRWFGSRSIALGRQPAAQANAPIIVEASTRLDGQTRLHQVQWAGRRVLIATSVGALPVVVDRAPLSCDGVTAPEAADGEAACD